MQGAFGQTFSRVEYFFDADPSPGQGTVVPVPGNDAVVNFSANVSAAALTPGFHRLAFRLLEPNVGWSHFESRNFYITSSAYFGDAPAINAAEYFIDADPGVGKGTPLNVGTAGNTVTFGAIIPANLTEGFHRIGIRTRDAGNKWGLYELRTFYINNIQADAAAITAAEYFFNTDPGVGKGTALNIGVSGNIVNFNAIIPTSLQQGFHKLCIRTRDANNQWGLYDTRIFYISDPIPDAGPITAAEYFFDADPGVGKGTAIPVAPSGNSVNVNAVIPVSLAPGFHRLVMRARDQEGRWGTFESKVFYVEDPATFAGNAPIKAIEYFFGQDPGPGKGFTAFVNPDQQADPLQQTIALPTPTCLTQGGQIVGIRLIDAQGAYSHFERANITVSGTVANLNPVTIKAGNWSNPAVWNTCTVPTGILPITVKHLLNVDVDVNCNSLKVERPADLRLQPGRSLNVNQ